MIEIIPNWHPIFVHLTVALLTTSVGFYVLAYLASYPQWKFKILTAEFEIVARWCLWLAALVTIATVSAGFYAYYTVRHDAISHAAMTTHRNWALSTAIGILLTACWSIGRYIKQKGLTFAFILALLIVQGLLLVTAWHGGELVYRYGLGVLSLPKGEEVGHRHDHQMHEHKN